jgi:hypothetical protein
MIIKKNICYLSIISLIIGQHIFENFNQIWEQNLDNQFKIYSKLPVNLAEKISRQPTNEKEGWGKWQQWDTFPHQRIQLGMSNSDYGAMMDLEYKCFGKVSSDNDQKKSDSYWYRISDEIKSSEYLRVEIGCWQENKFKGTSILNGLKLNQNSSSNSNSQLVTQTIKNCPREFTGWNLLESFETKSYSLAVCKRKTKYKKQYSNVCV